MFVGHYMASTVVSDCQNLPHIVSSNNLVFTLGRRRLMKIKLFAQNLHTEHQEVVSTHILE